MATTNGLPSQYKVRQMTLDDVPAVIELQMRAFPGLPPWRVDQLEGHLEIFPEGQLVVSDATGRIFGSASSLLIDWDDYAESANWSSITGDGSFATHNPLGKTLYGADMGVDPAARQQGIGTALYDARKDLIREQGIKRLLTGGRIPGYTAVAGQMTPKEYVAEVVDGKRRDPALSFQLENGLVVLDVVPGYMHDLESHGFATVLEWLNPEYTSSVSLQASLQHAALEQAAAEAMRGTPRPRRVRIAAVQYLLRPIACFEDFVRQVEFFVHSAKDYKAHFVLFPEFFTMQLLSYINEPAPAMAVRRLARMAPQYEELFMRLAKETGIYIIGGTHPVFQRGKVFNAAHLFTPNGQVFRQKKVHLTPTESGPYQLSRGHGLYLFHTDFGNIAILVCYDVEFPEVARVMAEAGAEILFVPSCTDGREGFCRVRYCAQARAIENQVYVAMTGTVGNLPLVPYMATNYGQAAILTPSDYFFARDGIAAEGTINQEQLVVADVDLDLLDEQRVNGSVIPLQDLIKDAYDSVVHFSDYKGQQPAEAALNGVHTMGQAPDAANNKRPQTEGTEAYAEANWEGVPAD
ncbi:MAG: GNAT family N-acetyltransferase [Terracidiphilus sp.]|jgi:predicted amidohydrolase/ribosomal protein S18 acetylase RimI-like enzyme